MRRMSWQAYVDDHLLCDIDGQCLTAAAAILSHDAFPQGPGGVTIKKTNLAIIMGMYEEPMVPGQCNMVVERLVDQGY